MGKSFLRLHLFPPFCSDGQSRAGVYCSANACIEQVIQHGEVDVFQAVKTVRRHRPQLVENIVRLLFHSHFCFHSHTLHQQSPSVPAQNGPGFFCALSPSCHEVPKSRKIPSFSTFDSFDSEFFGVSEMGLQNCETSDNFLN